MSLKNAALWAFCGSVLVAALLVLTLVWDVIGVVRGLTPAMTLFTAVIRAFAGLTIALFFYVFHVRQ